MPYQLTTGEKIDRLAIVTLKYIKIPEHRAGYQEEIDMLVDELNGSGLGFKFGDMVHATIVNSISHVFIWDNEGDIRKGEHEMDWPTIGRRLHRTHSLNGVRTQSKNKINFVFGERQDPKVDCIAEKEMADWPSLK